MIVASFARAPSAGRAFTAQVQRDLTIAFRSRSELINPLMFYAMGISMFPLGVGPGAERLAEIAPGVLWVLALLSTLLSLDSLFRRDFDDGTLEQLVLNVDPLFVGVLAKVFAHWLVIGLAAHAAVAARGADAVSAGRGGADAGADVAARHADIEFARRGRRRADGWTEARRACC